VPSRPDLHARWAARLQRDEEERHSRRMHSLRASIELLRRQKTAFEARVQSALADVVAEDAALASAVTEHVAAAVTRAEALAWECRAEFDRAAAVLEHRAARSSREHRSIRGGLEARGAWEAFLRRAGEDLAGDVHVEGAAPGAVAPVQALVDAAADAATAATAAAGGAGGSGSRGYSHAQQRGQQQQRQQRGQPRLEVERVLSIGYRGRLASGAVGPDAKQTFCDDEKNNKNQSSSRRGGGGGGGAAAFRRLSGGGGGGGGGHAAGTAASGDSPSSSPWRVHVIHVDAPDAARDVLAALYHGGAVQVECS
jgi:hypothetical protein